MAKRAVNSLLIPANVTIYTKKNVGTLIFRSDTAIWGLQLPRELKVEKFRNELLFVYFSKDLSLKSFFFLCKNLIQGVSKSYNLFLVLKGLGFRVQEANAKFLTIKLGFSHTVKLYTFKNEVKALSLKPTILELSSVSKQCLGNAAFNIRKLRTPNIYKGKGVLFRGEKISLKIGKKS